MRHSTPIFILFYFLFTQKIFAQSIPVIEWAKSYGGTQDDNGYTLDLTSDGGYILGGYYNSTNDDVTGNHGDNDVWIVKVDGSGNIQWKKCYGGSNSDQAYELIQTFDNKYVFAGSTHSNDGDVSGNKGGFDFW